MVRRKGERSRSGAAAGDERGVGRWWTHSKARLKSWIIYLTVGYYSTLKELLYDIDDAEVIDQIAAVNEELEGLVDVLRRKKGGI